MASAIRKGWRLNESKNRLDAVFGVGGASDPVVRFSMNATGLSFFNATPAARPTAYTQTYSTADRTHANVTQSTPPAGGTGATEGAYDTAVNRNLMIASITAGAVDLLDLKQLVNSIIDDLQAYGLLQ